ncbi:MAG: DNA repair protein RecO [Burkholderiales bacterium]|uniref:DNA repair protein RecO n=1 Tax=Inhella sp. TaxID=1921806 RepID=UPI001AD0648F|nr:DNA repair protein RecO [Burkholderiales bacterium]
MRTPQGLNAYILHAWDWRESSLILDAFTREQGRIALVAKGAKRPTSSLRAVLLPMQRLHLQLTKSKTQMEEGAAEVHTLRHAEWQAAHPLPREGALLAAYYLNELLMRLLPRGEAHSRLFDAYAQALHGLALSPGAPEAWLRAFELALLAELGWLPQLGEDSLQQAPLQAGRRYQLSPELGLVPSTEGQGLLAQSWLLIEQNQSQSLATQAQGLLQLSDRAQLKAVLRVVLHYHLGHQPLRSRAVLHQAHDLLA